ncbi:serine/threonine protein kinase [Entomophthora muscae]|uniref:Serine/threonine protein kinase n=1 Tax=Entomophthora muscae TaxID=34485 RepID=A0ACC2SBC1_9FUNG|nr:serine/threonine protein kinase [Entomophthora muscae]
MLFLAKPTECLAHPVDILLTHRPTTKGGYEVSPTQSALPRPAEDVSSPTQLNFLSLDDPNKPRTTTYLLQYLNSPVLKLSRTSLNSRYTRLNVRLALGAGTQVVESLLDFRLFLAKPIYQVSASAVDIGTSLQHENVLGIIDIVSHENQIMIITEFCTRDLLSVAQYARPTTAQILDIMQQLASGMHYLHLRGIAHRDLKLENIYMAGEVPKIAGLGCALVAASDRNPSSSVGKFGSKPYLAPEVHDKVPYNAYLADLWALGIILVGLCTGRFPWTCTQSDPNFARFQKSPRSYLQGLGLSRDKLLLALLLLVPDPAHRADSATLLRALGLPDPSI